MYHNILNTGERGVITYVSSDLERIFLKSASSGPEFVFINVEINKGQYVSIGNIYRSPSCTQVDDIKLCKEIEEFVCEAKNDVILVMILLSQKLTGMLITPSTIVLVVLNSQIPFRNYYCCNTMIFQLEHVVQIHRTS